MSKRGNIPAATGAVKRTILEFERNAESLVSFLLGGPYPATHLSLQLRSNPNVMSNYYEATQLPRFWERMTARCFPNITRIPGDMAPEGDSRIALQLLRVRQLSPTIDDDQRLFVVVTTGSRASNVWSLDRDAYVTVLHDDAERKRLVGGLRHIHFPFTFAGHEFVHPVDLHNYLWKHLFLRATNVMFEVHRQWSDSRDDAISNLLRALQRGRNVSCEQLLDGLLTGNPPYQNRHSPEATRSADGFSVDDIKIEGLTIPINVGSAQELADTSFRDTFDDILGQETEQREDQNEDPLKAGDIVFLGTWDAGAFDDDLVTGGTEFENNSDDYDNRNLISVRFDIDGVATLYDDLQSIDQLNVTVNSITVYVFPSRFDDHFIDLLYDNRLYDYTYPLTLAYYLAQKNLMRIQLTIMTVDETTGVIGQRSVRKPRSTRIADLRLENMIYIVRRPNVTNRRLFFFDQNQTGNNTFDDLRFPLGPVWLWPNYGAAPPPAEMRRVVRRYEEEDFDDDAARV